MPKRTGRMISNHFHSFISSLRCLAFKKILDSVWITTFLVRRNIERWQRNNPKPIPSGRNGKLGYLTFFPTHCSQILCLFSQASNPPLLPSIFKFLVITPENQFWLMFNQKKATQGSQIEIPGLDCGSNCWQIQNSPSLGCFPQFTKMVYNLFLKTGPKGHTVILRTGYGWK